MVVRKPAVAGTFYPSDPNVLSSNVEGCYLHPLGPGKMPPAAAGESDIVAVIAPHAGYEYSGPVAAHSFLHVSSLADPDLVVVVGPNHYGIGAGVSTSKEGFWETPLGRLRVDSEAASMLTKEGIAAFDESAHSMEHSIEVELPFLQMIYGDSVPFLPICLLFQDPETAEVVSRALAKVLEGRRAVVVASSDLTHYEPAEAARTKDAALIEKIGALDLRGFYSTLERMEVSACGYGAIATVMGVAGRRGLTRGELLKYANSGDTTGDNLQVVGYSSIRFV